MAIAQSAAPAMDLIVLAFVAGFALATLVFWPLLYRAHQQLAVAERTGHSPHPSKEARPRSTTEQPITTTSRTATKAAPIASPPVTTGTGVTREAVPTSIDVHEPDTTQPRAAQDDGTSTTEAEVPKDQGETSAKSGGEESLEIPPLPTDLYEQHYEAKFERARKRVARLRAQLEDE